MVQLIILRGNSGSGKSSVASAVRKQIPKKTALIEQDYFRRIVLKEKDFPDNTDILALLSESVHFAISHGYIVLLEGILHSEKYGEMLLALTREFQSLVFYMDVSFDETLRRHQTKVNAADFGEKEMQEWFVAKDFLGCSHEVVLSEELSFDENVARILACYHAEKALF